MTQSEHPRYFLVRADVLPEVICKVMEAKELLETGEAQTVADAAASVGISRSAFYKYKDSVSPFYDMKQGRIVTYHVTLRDVKGLLSGVLTVFADSGANILTINQSIPINGVAVVTISADTAGMEISGDELLARTQTLEGVIKIEALAA